MTQSKKKKQPKTATLNEMSHEIEIDYILYDFLAKK